MAEQISITYSTEGLTPNDGHEYDEDALARDIHARLESAVSEKFPDAEIDYHYPRSGFTKNSVYDAATMEENGPAQERIRYIMDDVYQSTDWGKFVR